MAACLVVMLLVLMPGAYIARDGYEFVPDTERWVALRNGLSFTIGKLDKKGNFLPDRRWVNLRGASYSGGPPATMLNSPDDEPVYEFRSGRLVKGRIDKEGSFVPDLGA